MGNGLLAGLFAVVLLRERPSYDPGCYLCPGNKRAGAAQNPVYTETLVFTNDFVTLLPDLPPSVETPHPNRSIWLQP